MKKVLKKVKESKGFISIETIVVAGVVILIGVGAFVAFGNKANGITNGALDQVDKATQSANGIKFAPASPGK